jgi:S1-C subfamily serine protease
MRPLFLAVISASLLCACEPPESQASIPASAQAGASEKPVVPALEIRRSVVRVTSTIQNWNPGQPWEKSEPRKLGSLGAVLDGDRVLTTAEMAADATYVELETVDGLKRTPAAIVAVDYEANLALLGPPARDSGDGAETPDEPEPPEENADAEDFFAGLVGLELAADIPVIGDELEIVQVRDNGTPILTAGPIQNLEMTRPLVPAGAFLSYQVKASMQSAASSFTLPVLREGKLAGLLTNYDSSDQLSDITATEVIRAFLDDAADGDYAGFPSLGVVVTATEDSNFRDWLGLGDDQGGLYLASVRPDSAAQRAGLQEGDVLMAIDGYPIDRQGYLDHDHYDRLFWSHLIRGAKTTGESVRLEIVRDGEPQEIEATLTREDPADSLIPPYTFGQAPRYLVKGGMIFQELTEPLLQAFGDEWRSRAPLNLLDAWENPEHYEEGRDRIVFLSGVIATPATVGYEPLRNLIVREVNGKPIPDIAALIAALEEVPADGLHAIDFRDEDIDVFLDETVTTQVDGQLLQRGLPRLSRAE